MESTKRYFLTSIALKQSYEAMVVSIVLLHNEKMNDALGNHKYVIYMKKEAFAPPKNTAK